jgi:uncharacterized protein (TIGR02145 family)
MTSGAHCVYGNDFQYLDAYGYLYNWYAVNDSRGLAPEGWHVPTVEEWKTLSDFIDLPWWESGKTLMEQGPGHWNDPMDPKELNSTGFTALPGGIRSLFECLGEKRVEFFALQDAAFFWTSNLADTNFFQDVKAPYIWLNNNSHWDWQSFHLVASGLSIRCVRDE